MSVTVIVQGSRQLQYKERVWIHYPKHGVDDLTRSETMGIGENLKPSYDSLTRSETVSITQE